jgi:hypothetical protein
MKITPEQIELMPALLESDYCEFRTRCREALSDSLENGDAIQRMKTIYGDFMRAFLHTMEEYDTPKEVVNELLTTL